MKRTLLATTAAAVLGLSTTLAAAQSTAPDTGTPEKHVQPGTPGKAPGAAAPHGNTGQTMQGHPAGTPNAQLQEPSGAAPKGQQHMNSQVQEQQPSGAAPKGQQHMNSQLPQQQEQRSGQPKAQQQLQQGQLQQQQNRQERPNGQNREVNQPPAHTGSVNQPNRQPSQTAQPSQNTQMRTQTARAPQVQITEQQRTHIHERISRESLHRVDHVDFSVSVGTVLPRTVVLYELLPTIVEIVPEYSGYRYVVVGDELLIIDPVSLEIVAVLPA